MNSRVSTVATRLVESGWLAALIIVPLLINLHSARSFEGDKIPLLRSIALIMLVAMIVRAIECGRLTDRADGRSLWRLPLMKPVGLLTFAYVVATIFSIAPHLSLWGSYERVQGLHTWLAYITIFVAIAGLARTPGQRDLVVTVVVLTSVPMAVYAVVQHFGADPIGWAVDVTARALGTTGNAIFLGGFMIMVVPLTLLRLIGQIDALRAQADARGPHLVALSAYLLALLLQGLAIVYSNSRGPIVGCAAALALFFTLLLRQRGAWRASASVLALALGAALFLLALANPGFPLGRLREIPPINALSDRLAADQGTARVRTLIWGAIAELLARDPVRMTVGYGPEALYLAFPPVYPPKLARYESLKVLPDRAHNDMFDSVTMTGIGGCLAQIWLIVAFFDLMLSRIGVVRSASQRRALIASTTLLGLLGVLAPYLIERSFRFSGLGLGAGIVAGVSVYLLVETIRSRDPIERTPRSLLALGLLAVVTAHFLEIQFGIAVSMTRLLFWVSLGLAVSLGMSNQSDDVTTRPPQSTDPVILGLLIGLVEIILTFDFYTPAFKLRVNLPQLPVLASAWIVGAMLAAADPLGVGRSWFVRLRDYAVTSVGLWLAFAILHFEWLNWRTGVTTVEITDVLPIAYHTANVVTVLYGVVAAVLMVLTIASLPRKSAAKAGRRSRLWLVLYAGMLLAAGPAIVTTNLNVSRADVFDKQSRFYLDERHPDAARLVAEEAVRLQPQIDHYTADLGTVLMNLARTSAPEQHEPYFAQALTVFERAEQISPLNIDNARNLGRLQRLWAFMVTDPDERTRHFDEADRHYQYATDIGPNNVSLWNERALLAIDRGRPDEAFRLLTHSVEVDDGNPTTLWIRGNAFLERQQFEQALADFDRALLSAPRLLAAWSGKGFALSRLNRYDEAIAANRSALEIDPNHMISHRNLALLYRQSGQLDLALDEANAALAVAKAPDDGPLKTLIAQLQEQLSTRQ